MGCWVMDAGCLMRGDGCGMPLEGFFIGDSLLNVSWCHPCKPLCTLW